MMKKILLFLIPALFLVACKDKTTLKKFYFEGKTMGSTYAITYFAEKEIVQQSEVDSFLAVFNKSLSTWDTTSLIISINSAEEKHITDSFFRHLYRKSKEIHQLSGGLFDPTGTPLFEAWGFGLKNADNMDSAKVDSLLQFVGLDKSTLSGDTVYKQVKGVQFTFNAIAPGYAADLLAQHLQKKGIDIYLIDIGGEFASGGAKPGNEPWIVSIETPEDNLQKQNKAYANITLESGEALATSGNYHKFRVINGKKYPHTLNPKTGFPVQHNLLSATIITNDATTADAYATTCMALGLEGAKEFAAKQGVKAFFIYDNNGSFASFTTDNLTPFLKK